MICDPDQPQLISAFGTKQACERQIHQALGVELRKVAAMGEGYRLVITPLVYEQDGMTVYYCALSPDASKPGGWISYSPLP